MRSLGKIATVEARMPVANQRPPRLADGAVASVEIAQASDFSRAPRRVLVADDDRETREVLAVCLKSEGWLVSEAANGREALRAAASVFPHVIVMDVCMPVLDGLEAVARLKMDLDTRDIPVVLCTGLPRARVERRAREAGCARFLTKPCSPEHLLGLLEELTVGRALM
jgi:CheY-like chemotaxis protein